MKRTLIIILVIMLAILTACSGAGETQQGASSEQTTNITAENDTADDPEESIEMKQITMRIDNEVVDVTWEDNESVKALAEIAYESPVTIESSMYGGFEQVGSIGTSLPINDVNMKTKPGDIVLYSGSNMVVFYGSNSWSYTMLGHIENKSEEELTDLLGSGDVTITLTAK